MDELYSVTAIILTRNEESQIASCIASLSSAADVVVVDSGSQDRTCVLARQLGASVYEHVPKGEFVVSAQRNWALEHCAIETPWVLFLDADERLTSELRCEIARVTSLSEIGYDAYELTPKFLFWGRWLKRTQGYPNWHPRLLRRGCVRFGGGIWEEFVGAGRIGKIEEPYVHVAESRGVRDWFTRHARYADWEAKHICAYLRSGDAEALGTSRKLRLRIVGARIWFLRPILRFTYCYIVRGGFSEGLAGFGCSLCYFVYELMVVIRIMELRWGRVDG